MNLPKSQEAVVEKIREWTARDAGSPSVLISQDDGSFHLGHYSGMGNSDNTPIEKLAPQYKTTIYELYQSGELIETGKAFTLYPGSDSFKKLVSVDS